MTSPPLYHVAACHLPLGAQLQPYAVALNYPTLIQLAVQALDAGPETITILLASDQWAHLVQQGNFQSEMVLLEATFERARAQTAPHLKSRLDAVYVWNALSHAERFRAKYRPSGIIHRCVLANGTTLERDGALVVEAFEAADLSHPSAADFLKIEERGLRYWKAQAPMALPEVLVHGTVMVAEILDPGADHPTAPPSC